MSDIKIFSGSASETLARDICDSLGIKLGASRTIVFSEGNIYVKIDEKVRGEDVYIVQTIGLDPNNELVELLFWIDAFKRSGVNSVTAIVPYFSYAKADKKDEPRVSIRARVCADCLETAGVDRVVTMDLHSPQVQGFFRKPVDHLYAEGLFCDHIRSMNYSDPVIVSPDEGFAKNARRYSERLRVPLAIGNKQRPNHDEKAEILGMLGEVKGKTAIIVDDFTISCGTLSEIAKLLDEKGAKEIIAYVSHSLLSDKGAAKLEESKISRFYTTDSVCNPAALRSDKITVLTIAELFAKAIRKIHEKESLSELFK